MSQPTSNQSKMTTTRFKLFIIALFSSLVLFSLIAMTCDDLDAVKMIQLDGKPSENCTGIHTTICRSVDKPIWLNLQKQQNPLNEHSSLQRLELFKSNLNKDARSSFVLLFTLPDLVMTSSLFDQKTSLLIFHT